MSKPFAWSHSRLNAFETCPHRFLKTSLEKAVVEKQSEQQLWGNRVHKGLEDRIKSRKPLDDALKKYEPVAQVIERHGQGKKVEAEKKLGLTKDLRETTYFSKDIWLRGIIDVTIEHKGTVFVGDYKTGKKKHDSDQLKLSAGMIFATRPWVDKVATGFVWLKEGGVTSEKFTRDDVPMIWGEFIPRAARMEEAIKDQNFPKRPSNLCREWCPVHSCEFNGKYTGGT